MVTDTTQQALYAVLEQPITDAKFGRLRITTSNDNVLHLPTTDTGLPSTFRQQLKIS
jgi:hypothetical protein